LAAVLGTNLELDAPWTKLSPFVPANPYLVLCLGFSEGWPLREVRHWPKSTRCRHSHCPEAATACSLC